MFSIFLIFADYSGGYPNGWCISFEFTTSIGRSFVAEPNRHKSKRNTVTNEDKRHIFGLIADIYPIRVSE